MNEHQSPDDEFRHIFDEAPVSLWVENFSGVKEFIDQLRTSGVDNLRTYFESHPEAVSACAKKVKVIQVNKATLDLYKADSEQQLLEGIDKTFTEESYGVFREELIALAEGKSSVASEAITKTLTGEPVYILIRISIMPGYEDTWSRLLVSMNDISERKQSEEKFRDMADKSLVGIYIIQNEIFKYVNPMLAKIFGYSEDEIINHLGPKHLTFEEDWPLASENIRKRIENKEKSIHYTFRGITRDKSIIEVEAFGSFTHHQGKPAIIGTLLDITERKQAEDALKSSEQKYRALIENSNDAIFIADAETCTIIEVNHRAEELVGLPHEKLIGMHQSMLHPPEDAEIYRERFRTRAVSGEVVNDDIMVQHSDGHKIPVNVSANRIEVEGRILIQGVFRDITERRMAEQILRESEQRLQNVLNTVPEYIFMKDTEGRYIFCNQMVEQMFGKSQSEIIGRTDFDLVSKKQAETFHESDRLAMESDTPQLIEETVMFGSDGHETLLQTIKTAVRGESREVIGVLGAVRDITAQRNVEQAFHNEANRNEMILRTSMDGFILTDDHGQIVDVNPAYCEMVGYSRNELISMNITQLEAQLTPDQMDEKIAQIVRDGSARFESKHRNKDGDGIDLDVSSFVMQPKGARPLISAFVRDISERKQAEENLTRLNRTLRMISECNQMLVRVSDEQRLLNDICKILVREGGYRMVWVGEAVHDEIRSVKPLAQAGFDQGYLDSIRVSWGDNEFGREPSGRAIREKKVVVCHDILSDVDFIPWRDQAIRYGYASSASLPIVLDDRVLGSLNIYAADAHVFHADEIKLLEELAGDVAFGVEVLRHRKEKEILEEQFRQAQKMEAIGILAGGIAHDFNNILAGMLGTVYLVRDTLNDYPEAQEKLKRVEQAGFRAAEMISQLLTFARKGMTDMQPVALAPFLKEAFKLARSSVPENISFTLDVPDVECTVKGDATLLQQALLNLVANARHAAAGQAHPEIHVSLDVLEANEVLWERHPDLPHKPYARLTVEDNGYGIPEEHLNKLFDPFFTTKGVGEGTGLGLAMVYGAVQSHEGVIEAESEGGKGSAFHVFLPLIEQTGISSQTVEDQVLEGHGETILLADDEKLVYEVSRRLLESMGYRVLIATNGEEAVRLFGEHQGEIRLAILDVVMPKLGGVDAALRIRVSAPDLPILFQTGYGEEQALKEIKSMKHCRVVTKPVAIPKLSRILHELLERGS